MDKNEKGQSIHTYLKRKLMAALSMVLVSALLMTTTTYAWLVMATAPEVTGISTNIGANGSLEIALLNAETRQDLSLIKNVIGESLATRNTGANNTWGNLIDLGYEEYGLGNITLLPTRLNVSSAQSDGKYIVDSGLLAIPTYGYDGRIIDVKENAFTAVYKDSKFSYTPGGTQDYGVRAIGTSDNLSAQGSALALAQGNIKTYKNNANEKLKTAMSTNSNMLFGIMTKKMSGDTFTDDDLDGLKTLLASLQDSLQYIDSAFRQGIIAVAASEIGSEATFTTVRERINDTSISLTQLLDSLNEIGSIPAEYTEWIHKFDETQNNLNSAIATCNGLSGGSYTWEQLKTPMNQIMNPENVFINDTKFSEFDSSSLGDLMNGTVELLLAPGSGVPADIADFAGNVDVWITSLVTINVTTSTNVKPPYLESLSNIVNDLEAADGSAEGETATELTTTYGYAIDLAFRCNASVSDLLLQTTPQQRVYGESVSASTMGGGSYMEFTSRDMTFTIEQMLLLMDAVRVGFIDDRGTLLGVAKLNTSNRTVEERVVKAPLYLYAYEFSTEDGSMTMGERQKTSNVITSLEQNVTKAITAVVWLDGDLVDNTMVSATESLSLTGVLNLQFASSANLIPMTNNALMNISADKSKLAAAVTAEEEQIAAGQGTYTTISWDAYKEAYTYAAAVVNNELARDSQIYKANINLANARAALEEVSHEAVQNKITEIREFMGVTEDLARYVIKEKDTSGKEIYIGINPYTLEQEAAKVDEIYRVDYDKNLQDEGNGVKTPIYTDESWNALAAALYDAEVVNKDPNATDSRLNDAITAIDVAYKGLDRRVYFIPYDYNGRLFYLANSEEKDTYGKWYDSDFKRVVSDRTIIELDGYAELADIAEIVQDDYIANNPKVMTTSIELLDDVYTDMNKDEIIAIQWNVPELFNEAITQSQIAELNALIAQAEEYGVAQELINKSKAILAGEFAAVEEVEACINELGEAVTAAMPETDSEPDFEPEAVEPEMTSDQRIVLETAISEAKTVEGYDNAENTKLEALRTAVAATEAVLAKESGATKSEAQTTLDALNAQLVANGKKEVTERNTIKHYIPLGSQIKELVYSQTTNAILYLTGENGTTTMKAVILTKNGVVYTAEKEVTVYEKAASVKIGEVSDEWDGKMSENATVSLPASLISREEKEEDENGNEVVKTYTHGEEIKSYTWSIKTGYNCVEIADTKAAVCVINAKAIGNVELSLSVETVQGNVYTDSIEILVTSDTP